MNPWMTFVLGLVSGVFGMAVFVYVMVAAFGYEATKEEDK